MTTVFLPLLVTIGVKILHVNCYGYWSIHIWLYVLTCYIYCNALCACRYILFPLDAVYVVILCMYYCYNGAKCLEFSKQNSCYLKVNYSLGNKSFEYVIL